MLLILTNRDDLTADYLILHLREANIPYYRFNADDFPATSRITYQRTAGGAGLIEDTAQSVELSKISAIWYRRLLLPKETRTFGDEAAPYVRHESRHFLERTFMSLSGP